MMRGHVTADRRTTEGSENTTVNDFFTEVYPPIALTNVNRRNLQNSQKGHLENIQPALAAPNALAPRSSPAARSHLPRLGRRQVRPTGAAQRVR